MNITYQIEILNEDKGYYTGIIEFMSHFHIQDEAISKIVKVGAYVLIQKIVKKCVSNLHKKKVKLKFNDLEVVALYYIFKYVPQSQLDLYSVGLVNEVLFELDELLV